MEQLQLDGDYLIGASPGGNTTGRHGSDDLMRRHDGGASRIHGGDLPRGQGIGGLGPGRRLRSDGGNGRRQGQGKKSREQRGSHDVQVRRAK